MDKERCAFEIMNNNSPFKENITGEIFTSTLRSRFHEIRMGDRVVFENIKAIGPANIEREIAPLSLTIR